MTYNSKPDVYILAAILLAIVVFLMGEYWIAGPVLLVLFLCAYPESYEITPEGLVVRTVLGRRLIPYAVIRFVGPRSGRMAVRYGCGSEILIAPAETDAFFTDMARHTPHLIRRGERLVTSFA